MYRGRMDFCTLSVMLRMSGMDANVESFVGPKWINGMVGIMRSLNRNHSDFRLMICTYELVL